MLKARTFLFLCGGLLGLALLLPQPTRAAWPTNPKVNVPICTAGGKQKLPKIVSDGAGGAIIAWTDSRVAGDRVYAQRISADGTVLWTADGVGLNNSGGIGFDNVYPEAVSDDEGGAIVTWEENLSGYYKIYAQRIAADGMTQWLAGGVALGFHAGQQSRPTTVSDGAGGAIVAWQDNRNFNDYNYDIYVQRISASGLVLWQSEGVVLCGGTAGQQMYPSIASDGAGGAIVTWHDFRTGTAKAIAQRIDSLGSVKWGADGVALCTAAGEQAYPTIASDGAGGAIVTWMDSRNGTAKKVLAQRLDAAGVLQWAADGIALETGTQGGNYPKIVSDAAGGAIVVWRRSNAGLYSQRISAGGTVQWTGSGAPVTYTSGNDYTNQVIPDGAGGAIVSFEAYTRDGTYLYSDIYSQRISASGTAQWGVLGTPVCTVVGENNYPAVTSDGAGGAIVAWEDARSGGYTVADIYAQRVDRDGLLSNAAVPTATPLAFTLDPVRPNPSRGGTLTVHFSLPTDVPARLELLDVAGRRIASRDVGIGQHTLDLGQGQHLAPGLYLVRLTQGANTRTTRVAVLR